VLDLVRALGWLACIVYSTIPPFWLLIHARVEHWRSQASSPYRVLVPLWIGMWIAVAGITSFWRRAGLYDAAWTWLLSLTFFVLGIWLYRRSGANFSTNQLYGLSELLPQSAEQRLVTTGVRAHVRHPVYLGHLCEMLAWSIGTGLAVCWGLTAVSVLTGAFMIRIEDAELERRFGEPYRTYRNSVPAVIPKLRPRL
jgi:protein-S-isoprenylcysteine O-methyltransferase Ste14